MGILDSGNWVLWKPESNGDRKPTRGITRLTISKKIIKLSAEARKAMGSPKFISVWTNETNGKIIFLAHNRKVSGSYEIRKTKSGTIFFRDQEMIDLAMERLILFGSMADHIGNDDKPLPGAFFCVDGEAFKEKDPKDGRRWLKGVEFDLASAYYCQIPQAALNSAKERWGKKEAATGAAEESAEG